jgi:DNA-binding PadR family transcriptional regulator
MSTRYALLGLLADAPMAGYQVKQHVDHALKHFWSESYGQIYPGLRALQEEGLATVSSEPGQQGPERHVYHISADGREALLQWLAAPTRRDAPVRNELMLKLFFGRHMGPAWCADLIGAYAEDQRTRLATLRRWQPTLEQETASDPDAVYRHLTLRMGILLAEARLAWCEESLARLRPAHASELSSAAATDALDRPPRGDA